jgi:glutaredoxin
LDAQVLGVSVDSVPCLQAWAESLGGIDFPLLSDFWPHGGVAEQYGVLRSEGKSQRALFVIDKEGIIRYLDIHDIDDQPDNEVLFAELRRIDPEAVTSSPPVPQTSELPRGGIVLYCSQWCPDCRRASVWLKRHNLACVEVDVNAVPKAAAQVREWTGGHLVTPTFDVDGTIVIDFDQKRLEELLLD